MIWERGAPLKSSPPLNIFDLEAWHLIYGIMNCIELSWFATWYIRPCGQPTAPTWLSKSAKMAELTICNSCLESVTGRNLSKSEGHRHASLHKLETHSWPIHGHDELEVYIVIMSPKLSDDQWVDQVDLWQRSHIQLVSWQNIEYIIRMISIMSASRIRSTVATK